MLLVFQWMVCGCLGVAGDIARLHVGEATKTAQGSAGCRGTAATVVRALAWKTELATLIHAQVFPFLSLLPFIYLLIF